MKSKENLWEKQSAIGVQIKQNIEVVVLNQKRIFQKKLGSLHRMYILQKSKYEEYP